MTKRIFSKRSSFLLVLAGVVGGIMFVQSIPETTAQTAATQLPSEMSQGAYATIPILKEHGGTGETDYVMIVSPQGHVWLVNTHSLGRQEESWVHQIIIEWEAQLTAKSSPSKW